MKYWLLKRAYSILDSAQPVPFDCGRLCNKKCCNGSNEDGMLLFPGEEKLFENEDGFKVISTEQGNVLICSGTCDRTRRPIACRIFPLFPYVTEENGRYNISVLNDTRAIGYCPLCDEDILRTFSRSVRMAARNLIRDEDCLNFLLQLTQDLTDTGNL